MRDILKSVGLAMVVVLLFPVMTLAQEAGAIDTGDTAWILVSAAFVMCMTLPGLALFYGGLVRRKNVLSTLMHSAILLCVGTIVWVVIGYTLAFGNSKGGFVGGMDHLMLSGVGADPGPAATIPHTVFMAFQLMFAAITPALITGAFAERMKFSTMLVFSVLWTIFVYCPAAHWYWGGGWIGGEGGLGAWDFAGGGVVHATAGFGALACVLVIGSRKGHGEESHPPHNIPMVLIGAGLLWFGWFGFNAGSALGANAQAGQAFVNTHISAAMATIVWMTLEWMRDSKPTVVGVATGMIAGLATITPAAGFVDPGSALIIGALAGAVCYFAVIFNNRMGFDDTLDVVAVHGVGGVLGMLCIGIMGSSNMDIVGLSAGGGMDLLWRQVIAIGATVGYAFVVTYIIMLFLKKTMGLRVTEEEETKGLDSSLHGEDAYADVIA